MPTWALLPSSGSAFRVLHSFLSANTTVCTKLKFVYTVARLRCPEPWLRQTISSSLTQTASRSSHRSDIGPEESRRPFEKGERLKEGCFSPLMISAYVYLRNS